MSIISTRPVDYVPQIIIGWLIMYPLTADSMSPIVNLVAIFGIICGHTGLFGISKHAKTHSNSIWMGTLVFIITFGLFHTFGMIFKQLFQ